ncbi:MAG TPA: hypothetical protein GXX31_05555 [Methanothermobacter sp.]|jgi:tRNA acetyltransferase TAN1|uniref:THUMP domain-containing protein n=1 Tax=Methanothermobacter tenebrarum TaxID=680118 RepID=A0ABN6PDU6_9EURY|nr:THUMP domain-containing protein [Methanothermobacter tenebrarum]MDD3453961.1 THUMP domain-containing protein [Methanobacteriales archaeon]MDX9692706.1 THUMP domain-containing protein [Methanothermobacter sp.]BDH79097.1 hypothetical protein MTTB_04760 [Methanothermobacter tenebrarum]HHW16820.1 hypothetical protein [Methanothermobacter sp.]
MKIPEYFNLLVTVCGQKGGVGGEELVGMEELELALQDYESPLNIKDCEFPNVILIDLAMDPKKAVKILENSPTTVISKVVPIEIVVKTRKDSILEKAVALAKEKTKPGDSFKVICDLRGRRYIKTPEEIIEDLSELLIDRLTLERDETNPKWIVQIEVVGENTGISILKPNEVLKKA